jgi:hypothetical protein
VSGDDFSPTDDEEDFELELVELPLELPCPDDCATADWALATAKTASDIATNFFIGILVRRRNCLRLE